MKVLIISQECWRDDSNGGNVLSNLFENWKDVEFAQIYCKGDLPQNSICKKYYRMNDKMVFKSVFKRKNGAGEVIEYNEWPDNTVTKSTDKKFYDFFRKYDYPIFFLIREMIWALAPTKNNKIKEFVTDFNPDIIFAPCYANVAMNKLDRWIQRILKKPMISYISDDNYSLKQFRLDPFYWIHRFIIRKNIRETSKQVFCMYTMTEQQADELSTELKLDMPILRKGIHISKKVEGQLPATKKIKIIYAGGTYLGRDKTLYMFAKAMNELKSEGINYSMDIYTSSKITSKYFKVLNDGENCHVHNPIKMDELKEEYKRSDIALHVESFKRKYAYQTRLSFSTKIVDCLESECVTIAICPKINAGWQYLKSNGVAYCISSLKNLKKDISLLLNDDYKMKEIRNNARRCLELNHDLNKIQKQMYCDFKDAIQNADSEGIKYENCTD